MTRETQTTEEDWLKQMPDSFKILWNSAKEMGVLDENKEGEDNGR